MPLQSPPAHSLARKSIPYLFTLLFVAQVLDLHSTLIGIATSRTEQNQLITWLALQIGFTPAIICFKAIAIATLVWFYRTWCKTTGQFDIQSAICLAFLLLVSFLVVGNNYMQ